MTPKSSMVAERRAGFSGVVLRQNTIRNVALLLAYAVTLCGCETSPAARKKVKEERWRRGRVFAEIRVLKERHQLLPGPPILRDVDFETYRQTQAHIITSPFVLQAAMRQPEVSSCLLLKSQAHPLDWLERNLEVTYPATEFIRVSMKTDERADAAKIINAVVDSYLKEVVDTERTRWKSRIRVLEKAKEDFAIRNKTKLQRFRRLAEEIGATSDVALSQAELAMVDFYALLRNELTREEFARSRDELDLMMLKKNAALDRPDSEADESSSPTRSAATDESTIARLEESLREHADRINDLRRRLEKQLRERKTTAVHSLELEALQHEIGKDRELLDLINDELTRAELEGEPEGRVTLFRKAEAEDTE